MRRRMSNMLIEGCGGIDRGRDQTTASRTDPRMTPSASKRVLVVEDEIIVAMLIEDMLSELGHVMVGSANTVASALALAEANAGQFDLAILDVNLAGERSFPVARRLASDGVRFIFATGYGQNGVEDPFRDTVTLKKPFRLEELAAALDQAADG
jgi:CheY-like chemotaxis protein